MFSISMTKNNGLSPACLSFYFNEVKHDIVEAEKTQRIQFGVLLEYLENHPPESLDLLFLSMKAITPRFENDNTYQLTISSGPFFLYLCEVNERMRDFLYEYVFDYNGYVKKTLSTSGARLKSLWLKFPESNSTNFFAIENKPHYFRAIPVSKKKSAAGEKNIALGEVLDFKKIQSSFKRELYGIQSALNVLNSPEAIEKFKKKKTVELVIQTGVHTGLSVTGSTLGAVIGTAIAPGIGSLIGAGVGAGISCIGKKAYDYAASRVSNRINPNPHLKTQNISRNLKSAEKGRIWWCGAKIKSICVKPSRAASTLSFGLISFLIKEVSLPLYDIATACYDYGKAYKGLPPEKADKIEILLEKYHVELKEKYQQVLDYLEANPTPGNQRRKIKILARDEVISNRLEIIRKSIKDAMEARNKRIRGLKSSNVKRHCCKNQQTDRLCQ